MVYRNTYHLSQEKCTGNTISLVETGQFVNSTRTGIKRKRLLHFWLILTFKRFKSLTRDKESLPAQSSHLEQKSIQATLTWRHVTSTLTSLNKFPKQALRSGPR